MRQLTVLVSRSTFARRMAIGLGLHKIGNFWLRRFPSVKQLPGGIKYRASRLESIPLAAEMFSEKGLYNADLLPKDFTTFADLGCNVGYFTCWLAHLAQPRKLRGIAIDANAEALKDVQWHVEANGMTEVFPAHGIVGERSESGFTEFYVYESNICSTRYSSEMKDLKGKWETIRVPCINVEEQWNKHFGGARCNVLKIDIEGSELKFLENETSFLNRCDCVFVEWHKWAVQFDKLKSIMDQNAFRYCKILEENDQMGTAFFRRD